MEPRSADPAAPAMAQEDDTGQASWPDGEDSPAAARWRRMRVIGRYEDFLRCSVDWLWETDANLALRYVSSPVALALGIPAQVLVGRPLPSLGHFETGTGTGALQLGPLRTQRPFRDAAFLMTGTDQRQLRYLLSGVPYYEDPDGRFAGFRGTARAAPAPPAATAPADLAPLTQALEEALLRNADLSWRLSRLGDAMAAPSESSATPAPPAVAPASLARTAHELRTPLNAIIGYAELGLSEVFGPLGERYQDCFRTMREAGRHMDELVAGLLAPAAPAGQAGLVAETVDIVGVVAKAKAMIALAARAAEVDISRVGPVAGGLATGNARACVQIILNLLSNAVKFTPAGGSIGLETVVGPNGTLQIVVWDSGIGIPPDEQQKIFEPSYRAARAGDPREIPGSGLGLSISRDLARAMAGELSVISQPGQGSRFILSLPSAAPPSAQA